MLTNQEFTLGIVHTNYAPDKHFWNKFTSPIDHTEAIDLFLTECFMVNDIDLSHTLDPNTPNDVIRDYCMCDDVKIANEKDYLKYDTFKYMIN